MAGPLGVGAPFKQRFGDAYIGQHDDAVRQTHVYMHVRIYVHMHMLVCIHTCIHTFIQKRPLAKLGHEQECRRR